jgi:serine/threonine-protein kinase
VKTQRERGILANRYLPQAFLDDSPVGAAWLSTDTVLNRTVTVTLVDADLAADERARQALFANARALAAAPASHLVRILDAGMDGDHPFLVTERVADDNLADVLERDGPLPAGRAADVVADVLEGMAEAHAVGVLHLDPSPVNVVFDDEGRTRLRNAGVAPALAAGSRDDASATSGPPEGPVADARGDVWCAGALLLTALTTRAPTDPAREAKRAHAPRSIRAVLARALADDPDQRFTDAPSMASALRAASAGAMPRSDAGRGRAHVFRTWIAVPLLVVLVVTGVVASGLWLGRLEIGGPVGIRLHEAEPSRDASAAAPLGVAGVTILDPYGDGHENDDALAYAADGDPATVWRSENYFDGSLNKAGLGLVLDLGAEATVTGFRLQTPTPGFTFSVLIGDDPSALIGDTGGATSYVAPQAERALGQTAGRYVVIWITSVVETDDGANRAEISDVRILGSR